MPADLPESSDAAELFPASSRLPTIVGKPADSCQQVCPQLSTDLLTIVGKRLNTDWLERMRREKDSGMRKQWKNNQDYTNRNEEIRWLISLRAISSVSSSLSVKRQTFPCILFPFKR